MQRTPLLLRQHVSDEALVFGSWLQTRLMAAANAACETSVIHPPSYSGAFGALAAHVRIRQTQAGICYRDQAWARWKSSSFTSLDYQVQLATI